MEKLSRKQYESELARLSLELVKLQYWIKHTGERVVLVFEGRDAAGKGGTIKRIVEPLNPRGARVVALGTPSDRERTQWYFQRYAAHLPAAGELVLFDRSWYNRAGVEHVMGFCTNAEYREFLRACPEFERMLVRPGPAAALEAQPDGPRVTRPLGRVLAGQGRDAPAHAHAGGAVVHGRGRRQAARAADLHRPRHRLDPARGRAAARDRAPAAPAARRLRAAGTRREHGHPRAVTVTPA
jgi:hypothetical protein